MRLIDADALTEQIQKLCHYEYMANWLGVLIDTQPTVKVEPIEVPKPVRHGRWKFIRDEGDGNSLYECSECGQGDIQSPEVIVPYCWHCGAKMDAERKEE